MNIKELMLGNWVLAGAKTQFPMQVVGVFKDVVYLDFEGNEGDVWEEKEDDILPIPLTEELLVKNGFERNGRMYYIKGVHSFELYESCMKDFFVTINDGEYKVIDKPMYLHQLQNLLTLAGIEFQFKV